MKKVKFLIAAIVMTVASVANAGATYSKQLANGWLLEYGSLQPTGLIVTVSKETQDSYHFGYSWTKLEYLNNKYPVKAHLMTDKNVSGVKQITIDGEALDVQKYCQSEDCILDGTTISVPLISKGDVNKMAEGNVLTIVYSDNQGKRYTNDISLAGSKNALLKFSRKVKMMIKIVELTPQEGNR